MEPTPLHDVIQFLSKPAWFTHAFWVLLLVSMAIAALTWQRDPQQRTARCLAIWALRVTSRGDVVATDLVEDSA